MKIQRKNETIKFLFVNLFIYFIHTDTTYKLQITIYESTTPAKSLQIIEYTTLRSLRITILLLMHYINVQSF